MSPFEYLLLFAAVILGLAITDVAVSLHRLLAAGSRVRWDWLAPLAAVVAFLKIVTQWWAWYAADRIAAGLTFEMFIGVLAGVVLLFLLAAEALPDEFGDGPVDLRAHYAAVSRRFWLIFAIQWVLTAGVGIWAQMRVSHARFDVVSPVWLVPPVALSLAFIRSRWLHALAMVGFVAIYVGQFFGQTLAR